ncbi:MAG: hypothetical protein N3A71_03550 [Candidatus Dojkabacteria bacterium]|nr:hypothetical protein [Candidatus Dojkabacteria bacterium]
MNDQNTINNQSTQNTIPMNDGQGTVMQQTSQMSQNLQTGFNNTDYLPSQTQFQNMMQPTQTVSPGNFPNSLNNLTKGNNKTVFYVLIGVFVFCILVTLCIGGGFLAYNFINSANEREILAASSREELASKILKGIELDRFEFDPQKIRMALESRGYECVINNYDTYLFNDIYSKTGVVEGFEESKLMICKKNLGSGSKQGCTYQVAIVFEINDKNKVASYLAGKKEVCGF